MGAETSTQRDEKSKEDVSAEELSAEMNAIEEGGTVVEAKALQKNGQISSMSSLNSHSEDNAQTEVGQPDSVSVAQKEEAPETMDAIQDELTPQVNGEKVEKESPDAIEVSTTEEKPAEEKTDEANEVGFKKIFRFVGFKFTLKKDKSEEKDPVTLLTVKDKEGEKVSGSETAEDSKAATAEETETSNEQVEETKASSTDTDHTGKDDRTAADEPSAEGAAAEGVDEEPKEEANEKESEISPPAQEVTQSPFRKLFTGGLFSNLRKKTSVKKSKDEEEKEAAGEEEMAEAEETDEVVGEDGEKEGVKHNEKEGPPATTPEPTPETEATTEPPAAAVDNTDEPKAVEENVEATAADEKPTGEVTTEAELLTSQEKAKPQGSPLKKLFTGAGLKKLSTKKQKSKKDTEAKFTESGEQAAEQLQSSTESAESQKPDSGASSPEDSGEHAIIVEADHAEPSQEAEEEGTSDGEKKKEGIIPWSSFKKLVTPKKRVKRPSESDEEITGEKPAKSATLSSTESAVFAEKEVKEEETKEDKPTEEEPKTETTEKLVSSTEEPKKKMDTSVSWEALMCMGGAKKRTRKTSDSDDEETKIEEEAPVAAGEEELEGKSDESQAVSSQEAETEAEVKSSPEPVSCPPERESAWDTLKRFVMSKNKAKVEEKTEESSDQALSDSEVPKEESSFSLRKLFPGRRKKKVEKQASCGSAEDDSDTPAVVPLSEYDGDEQAEAKVDEPSVTADVQTKVTSEDRSPSWIPAVVEVDDNQLSDIPEEAENAATPKSADTTIADDIEDQPVQSPGALDKSRAGRRLSLAEVKPVLPAPAAESSHVPQEPQSENAECVLEAAVEQVSKVTCQTSVTVEDVPLVVASAEKEDEPAIEKAECKTKTILEPHARDEAMAICTGLGTKEIAKIAVEKPLTKVVECMAVISDALCAEVLLEEKPDNIEEAIAVEEEVLKAQVHQVESTNLEPATEDTVDLISEVQNAAEGHEHEIEKTAIVCALPEQSEVVQPTEMSENSPKVVMVNPITPTIETTLHAQSIQVTRQAIEIMPKNVDVELLTATEGNAEMVQTVTQEIASTLSDTTKSTVTEGTETSISGVLASTEVALAKETVVFLVPLSAEPEQVQVQPEAGMEKAAISDHVGDKLVQVQENKEVCQVVAEDAANTSITVPTVTEQISETTAIEEKSMVIAQAVVQNAMDKMSEAKPEPQKPTTPTSTMPTTIQAMATTEKDIEFVTVQPVISETPVPVLCETPAPAAKSPKPLHAAIQVIDTFPVEVLEILDRPGENQDKSAEELKKAVEVKASEETVVMEEVVKIKLENQTDAEPEEVKEEQSKEEATSQKVAPTVEDKEEEKKKKSEIHTPVQVVLQIAHVVEDPTLEEAVVEFDSNGPVDDVVPFKDAPIKDNAPASQEPASQSLSTLMEESPMQDSTEATVPTASPAETEKAAPGKCAEVMAQVIEVIEEAVKEIEPVSTEITAAS